MKKLTGLSALVLVISAFLFIGSVAFARGDDTNQNGKQLTLNRLSPKASESGESPEHANPRACQAKEDAVKKRSLQLVKLATNMEVRFDTIAARVENFTTSSGKTIPNYNALLADIAAKKAAVSAALVTSQADAANFSCTSNDPKGQLVKFRLDMQVVKDALKNYRSSIKNLIVTVRTTVSGTHEATESGKESTNSGQKEGQE